jgi:fermentation-respiration switch protein FrsA (DUF1100 family)
MQDEMVPFKQMQRLHHAVRTQRCTWVEFPDASHMDAYETNKEMYWPALRGFLEQYVQ